MGGIVKKDGGGVWKGSTKGSIEEVVGSGLGLRVEPDGSLSVIVNSKMLRVIPGGPDDMLILTVNPSQAGVAQRFFQAHGEAMDGRRQTWLTAEVVTEPSG